MYLFRPLKICSILTIQISVICVIHHLMTRFNEKNEMCLSLKIFYKTLHEKIISNNGIQ